MKRTIILAPDKGGVHEFSGLSDAETWAHEQATALHEMFFNLPAAEFFPELPKMQQAWEGVISTLAVPFVAKAPVDIHADHAVMTAESPAAQALIFVGKKLGGIALRGAFYAADVGVSEIDWSRQETIAGIQLYEIEVAKRRRLNQNAIPFDMDDGVAKLNNQIQSLHRDVLEISSRASHVSTLVESGAADAESKLNSLVKDVELANADFVSQARGAEARLEAMASASQFVLAEYEKQSEAAMKETSKRLDDWMVAQMQAVRLAAPVKLWTGRSRLHRKAGKDLGKFALKAGVIGTFVTPFVAWLAFLGARKVLSDATLDQAEAAKATAAGIRPTLHFELIFAGTTTLFWLTMFFWLMRLVVKRYTGEQRMAIDASGRSAMAQTYLGFIAEGAAGEKERPMIVEALFRPVTADGKGDDGPPAISVPSVFSALVAGKSG